MKVKSAILASVLALTATVVQADHDGKTYTFIFDEPTLVFQCRDVKTLLGLFKDVNPENLEKEILNRVTAIRNELLPNGNPRCDFIVTTDGKYGAYDRLTEVAPVSVYKKDLGKGKSLNSGVYVAKDVAGDPMYMFLVSPIQDGVTKPGFDSIARLIGSN